MANLVDGELNGKGQRDQLLHELQSELLHVSRLSTIGEMASALAHELNQPLAALANYLRGSRRLLEASVDARAGTVRDALDKASEQAIARRSGHGGLPQALADAGQLIFHEIPIFGPPGIPELDVP